MMVVGSARNRCHAESAGSEMEASGQLTRGTFGGFHTRGGRMAHGLLRSYAVSFRSILASYFRVRLPETMMG